MLVEALLWIAGMVNQTVCYEGNNVGLLINNPYAETGHSPVNAKNAHALNAV